MPNIKGSKIKRTFTWYEIKLIAEIILKGGSISDVSWGINRRHEDVERFVKKINILKDPTQLFKT